MSCFVVRRLLEVFNVLTTKKKVIFRTSTRAVPFVERSILLCLSPLSEVPLYTRLNQVKGATDVLWQELGSSVLYNRNYIVGDISENSSESNYGQH